MRWTAWIACGGIALAVLGGAHAADDATPSVEEPPPDPAHTMQKKGWPNCLSRLARPSESPNNVGYTIGGGCPRACGDPPAPHEGTWGWDYQTPCIHPRIILNWWHGRYQGGMEGYKTDGPKLCPKK